MAAARPFKAPRDVLCIVLGYLLNRTLLSQFPQGRVQRILRRVERGSGRGDTSSDFHSSAAGLEGPASKANDEPGLARLDSANARTGVQDVEYCD